jgi:hypothetical protein
MRILTGHAGHISLSLVAKCGGVVVGPARIVWVVNFKSMFKDWKWMMTMMTIK